MIGTVIMEVGDRGVLQRCVQSLRNGGYIVVPTETVYGIAVRADDDRAVSNVYAAKGRPADKNMALLVAKPDNILTYMPDAPEKALLLARKFWPGMLTIVVDNGSTALGFRCPAHPFTLLLAETVPFPVFLTSANLSGTPPVHDTQGLRDLKLIPPPALIVNGGASRTPVPTTVVRVSEAGVNIVRDGAINPATIPFLVPDARLADNTE
jgi:L-threonylcarbamoyladenylate synthase